MSTMPLPKFSAPNPSVPDHPLPRATPQGYAGTILFVAGMTVLFAAALIAYVVVRAKVIISMPPLPWIFWFSTFAVLVSSVFLQYAINAARLGRGTTAHRALLTATGLGFLFLGLQGPGLVMLGQMNMAFTAVSVTLYALTLILIGLHLLHVIGGLFVLTRASLRSERQHYTGGDTGELGPIAIYWHFLAVLWVVLFSALLILN